MLPTLFVTRIFSNFIFFVGVRRANVVALPNTFGAFGGKERIDRTSF